LRAGTRRTERNETVLRETAAVTIEALERATEAGELGRQENVKPDPAFVRLMDASARIRR
jgi:hypothetical protein